MALAPSSLSLPKASGADTGYGQRMIARRSAAQNRSRLLIARVAITLPILGACAPQESIEPPANPAAESTGVRPTFVRLQRPRLFVLPMGEDLPYYEERPDGAVRAIVHGLRVVEQSNGALAVATELLPELSTLQTVELPQRLGGGYLFYGVSDESTPIWRAKSWIGNLEPLVTLPFGAASVTAGFDRVYVVDKNSGRALAIDPRSGEVRDARPLPAAVAYGNLVFVDAWMAAAEADLRGPLVTFDAGGSWRPIGVQTTLPAISEGNGLVVVNSTQGRLALQSDGVLTRLEGAGGDRLFTDVSGVDESLWQEADESEHEEVTAEAQPSRFDAIALSDAILRGVRVASDRAIVANQGILSMVSLVNGEVIDQKEKAYPEASACQGVRLGRQAAFVCGAARSSTAIYRYRAPLSLEPVLRFTGPRFVANSQSGTLIIRGGCDPTEDVPATYCALGSDRRREIRVQGDTGAERLAALEDGRVVVLVPPRFGTKGRITIVSENGKATSVPLKWRKVSPDVAELLEEGLWLDGVAQITDESLSAWVAGSGPFVGVRIDLDGNVRVGPPRGGIGSALLSGPFGLWRGTGELRETTDGGMTWREVELPAELAHAVTSEAEGLRRDERGCSAMGCAFGKWVRVGWGENVREKLASAREPPRVRTGKGFFVNWALRCQPTGASSGPTSGRPPPARRPSAERTSSSVRSAREGALPTVRNLTSGAWRPFLGVPAPPLSLDDLGFDFGTEDHVLQVRGYGWGPRHGRWDRSGRWLVRVVDRFAVSGATWSTRTTRTPWEDALEAARSLGSDPSHRSTTEWSALLEPGGEAALLSMRISGETRLALLEKDRPIHMVREVSRFALDRLGGAAKVGSTWYLGTEPNGREFHVLEIQEGQAQLLGAYPRYAEGPAPQVVRTARGDGLGIWVVQKGRFGARGGGDTWFVFPIDRSTGQTMNPIRVGPEQLAGAPRPCDNDDDGWLVVHAPSVSVTNIDVSGIDESVRLQHVEAKLVLSDGGVCMDSIAARADGGPLRVAQVRSSREPVESSVPLALTDRSTDRRWGFRCSP